MTGRSARWFVAGVVFLCSAGVPAAARAAVEPVERRVLVVLADTDAPDTAPGGSDTVMRRVAAVYREQVGLTITATTTSTTLPPQTCSDFATTRADTIRAVPTWETYDHVVVALDLRCDAVGGLGELPGRWSVLYRGAFDPYVVVHELAHNLGLGHSLYSSCVATGNVRPGVDWRERCTLEPYVDGYSPTATRLVQFSAPELVQLGAPVQVADVDDGVVDLRALAADDGVRALRAPSRSEDVDWWVEYRVRQGRDALLPTDRRIVIRRVDRTRTETVVFDPTGTGSGEDIGFQQPGESFTTPDGTVQFIAERISDTAAVRIVRRDAVDDTYAVGDLTASTTTAGASFTFAPPAAAVRGYVITVRNERGERATWLPAGTHNGVVPYEIAGNTTLDVTSIATDGVYASRTILVAGGLRPGAMRALTVRGAAGTIALSWANPCRCTSIVYDITARARGHATRTSSARGGDVRLTGLPRGTWEVRITPTLRGVRGATVRRTIAIAAGTVGIDVARYGAEHTVAIRFRRAPAGGLQLWWRNRSGTVRQLIAADANGWAGTMTYSVSVPTGGAFEVHTLQRRYTPVAGR
jgi:hypothetical protein